jgi:hypothetical protein
MGCHFSGYSGYGRNKDEALVSLQSITAYYAGKSEIIKVRMCDGIFNDYLRYEYDE